MKKNQARKKYKDLRNKLSNQKIKKLSNQIFQQGLKLKIWNKQTYMLYNQLKQKKKLTHLIFLKFYIQIQKTLYTLKSILKQTP